MPDGTVRARFAPAHRRPARAAAPGADALAPTGLADRLQGDVVQRATDAETLRQLKLADGAIRYARDITPDGAGNQRRDVLASHGMSYARVALSRRYPNNGTALMGAEVAKLTGGANCGEYAALTYARLASQGGVGAPVQFGHLSGLDHGFTMIGDPRMNDKAIVVDAWVNEPQAHLWKDSHWNQKDYGAFEVVETFNQQAADPKYRLRGIKQEKMDEGRANRILHLPDGMTALEMAMKVEETAPFLWDQQRATRDGQRIRYTLG